MEPQNNPMILVFYMDRQIFVPEGGQPPMITYLSATIEQVIEQKKMNAVAFFLPTDTEERIECINPAIVPADEMEKINKMVKDIQDQFSIGGKLEEDPNEELEQ
jgi:hypothetical protein